MKHIPIDKWGRDHWSTLLYIESICVDGDGVPVAERMRQWAGRPCRGKLRHAAGPMPSTHPTRLKDGTEIHDHDDFNCAADIEAAGLIRWGGTGMLPLFSLTPLGWKVASALRRHMAESRPRTTDTFDPTPFLQEDE